jgi:hypothetical protein
VTFFDIQTEKSPRMISYSSRDHIKYDVRTTAPQKQYTIGDSTSGYFSGITMYSNEDKLYKALKLFQQTSYVKEYYNGIYIFSNFHYGRFSLPSSALHGVQKITCFGFTD